MVDGQIVGYIYIQQLQLILSTENIGQQSSLDRERDKAVVLLDVPFEDVRAGAQNPLEPGPVQLDAPEGTRGSDGGGPGSVQHESDLSEVVRRSEDSDLLAVLPLVPELGHRGVPRHDDVEIVARLALSDHGLASLE